MRKGARFVVAALLVAPLARGQDGTGDAVAEALFRDGRSLMTAGRYPEACAKLAESQRIDPHIGTLLNLAACRALEGRTATAWAEYEEARAQAARGGRTERESFATEQLRALEPRLARVRVGAANPPPGLLISLDGQELEAGVLGTSLPVDPGTHQLRATAPGRASWSVSFLAREGATETIHVPDLPPIEVAPMPVSRSPRRLSPSPPPPEEAAQPRIPSRTSPFVWVFGGTAVVGIGVGSVLGVETFVRNGDANSACPRDACTAAGLKADSDARTYAAISDVAFLVAGAAAAGAVVLFAVGRGDRASHVGLGPTGIRWEAAW